MGGTIEVVAAKMGFEERIDFSVYADFIGFCGGGVFVEAKYFFHGDKRENRIVNSSFTGGKIKNQLLIAKRVVVFLQAVDFFCEHGFNNLINALGSKLLGFFAGLVVSMPCAICPIGTFDDRKI